LAAAEFDVVVGLALVVDDLVVVPVDDFDEGVDAVVCEAVEGVDEDADPLI